MPTKTKKITAKEKREAVAKTFGDIGSPDPDYLDFLYARRDLATVHTGYIIELLDFEEVINGMLKRIRERDGDKIFREAAEYLLNNIAPSVSNEHEVSADDLRRPYHRCEDPRGRCAQTRC
jgi:hypothetical protein